MNRIRLALMLAAGLSAAIPARTDQACQDALATIDRATDTLTKMQALLDGIGRGREQAAAIGAPGTAADRGAYVLIDMQSKANHALAQDMNELQGNNLKGVPQGEQRLAGPFFKIGPKIIRLRGAHALTMPDKVEGIPVEAPVSRLHLLHGTGYNVSEGTEIGAYIVHFGDGATERIPIIYGQDIHNWWIAQDQADLKRARVAWKGTNSAAASSQMSIALFDRVWVNPHPEKQVHSIDFVSRNTECDPFLLAVSVEKP